MATDIAFALGVPLLGPGVPDTLEIFLVALAIADDLGAVLVIALFYASSLNWAGLGLAAAFLAAMVAANRGGFRHPVVYLCLGIGLWYGVLISGVHATLAGVLAALTVPARVRIPPHRLAQVVRRAADRLEALDAEGDMDSRRFAVVSFLRKVTQDAKTPLQRFEHMAHPWVAFVIMPASPCSTPGSSSTAAPSPRCSSRCPSGSQRGWCWASRWGSSGPPGCWCGRGPPACLRE
jgi:NhaA family Na+:H+ antiporter